MIREKVTVKDYERISSENEYYIWHFIRKTNMGPRTIYSVLDEPEHTRRNQLKTFLEMCDIPYFESYIEDSINFIDNIIPLNRIWNKKDHQFNSFVLGFNKRRMITSTLHGHCLCIEGISEIIYELNPDFIERINLD
jgi:hypothetical protein